MILPTTTTTTTTTPTTTHNNNDNNDNNDNINDNNNDIPPASQAEAWERALWWQADLRAQVEYYFSDRRLGKGYMGSLQHLSFLPEGLFGYSR